jgi:hypothetical protein
MTVARVLISVLVLASLPACTAGQVLGQVCGTVGATAEEHPSGLLPPAGYAYVSVDAPDARAVAIGRVAEATAESIASHANRDLPGVVTRVWVLYALARDARVGASRRVCSSTPIVLRVFQVNPAMSPALRSWKIEITRFGGTTFNQSDLIYHDQQVAPATGMLNGKPGQQYVWLHQSTLFWVYGPGPAATATFVEAVLAEQSSQQ